MISKELLDIILQDPFYEKCIRFGENTCKGRITFEHVWVYSGRQIQELWSIVPLCELHHAVNTYQDGGDLNKEIGELVSLERATRRDLEKYPKRDWAQRKRYLIAKYGRQTTD